MVLVPLILISPLLVLAAYCDLRFLRIPNLISLAIIAIFGVSVLLDAPDDLMTRLLAASVVLGLGFLAFAARLVGGGDVKLLSALVLFVPTHGLPLFSYLFSVALLVGVASILALRRSALVGKVNWKSLSQPKAFPMGLSIALAGLTFPMAVGLA